MGITMNKALRYLTMGALFAALSTILMYFEFPLPLLPPFLKIDLSNVPILIFSFIFGPFPAILVVAVKDLIHFFTATTTAGVGELADFIVTSSFVITAGIIYQIKKTKLGAILGCLAGTIVIAISGALSNQYLIIPFYSKVMPIEAIIDMCSKVNSLIVDINSYILYGVIPFNIIKGVIISVVTVLLYKNLSPFIKSYIVKK